MSLSGCYAMWHFKYAMKINTTRQDEGENVGKRRKTKKFASETPNKFLHLKPSCSLISLCYFFPSVCFANRERNEWIGKHDASWKSLNEKLKSERAKNERSENGVVWGREKKSTFLPCWHKKLKSAAAMIARETSEEELRMSNLTKEKAADANSTQSKARNLGRGGRSDGDDSHNEFVIPSSRQVKVKLMAKRQQWTKGERKWGWWGKLTRKYISAGRALLSLAIVYSVRFHYACVFSFNQWNWHSSLRARLPPSPPALSTQSGVVVW